MKWEREIYAATSPRDHNEAVLAKCEVRKQQGLYEEALAELSRIHTYALTAEELEQYYTQRALCAYLAGRFEEALTTTEEAKFYLPEGNSDAHLTTLIEALAAGELGDWGHSHTAALAYAATLPEGETTIAQLEELYSAAPRLRNPQTAWWLSLLPGVGQFYAGELWSGLVSLVANGALGYFAVSEAIAGEWLSGWVIGCGGLSTTYFVGQERARILTERRNARVLREHNDLLRQTLLQLRIES